MGLTIFWVAFNDFTSHSCLMKPNRMAQLLWPFTWNAYILFYGK